MKNLLNNLKAIWKDESGMGTLEMVMLGVLLISLVIFAKPKIQGILGDKINSLGGELESFTAN